jgi:lipoprotein-releasing system ATP-binding protein
MSLLIAKKITKTFLTPCKTDVLKGVDFSLSRSESVAIMGESGEGKSTFLNILAGLDFPTSGSVFLFKERMQSTNAIELRRNHFGFIFQSFHLIEDLTVLENVMMPLKIAKKENEETKKKAIYLLDRVGLKQRKDYLAKLLSGGEKQRVAIARALVNDPDVIFADEPTGNLDEKNTQIIHELLFSLVKEEKKALLITTHSSHLAHLCEKTFLLKNGQLVK